MKYITSIFLFFIAYAYASPQSNENQYLKMLSLADSCLTVEKSDMAFYYITRYAALVLFNSPKGESLDKLQSLMHKLGLQSTAFISGFYSPEFLEWYIKGTYFMWGAPDRYTSAKECSSVIAVNHDSIFFVGIEAFPTINQVAIIGGNQSSLPSTYLHLASAKKPPVLVVGFIDSVETPNITATITNNCDGYQHFWNPEIMDLDADGNPEILVRYNMALFNGFAQKLDVFRVKGKKVELVSSLLGPVEEIARRIGGNRFQQGQSTPSSSDLGHLGYDQTEIQEYIFSGGKFVSTGPKKVVPNILLSTVFMEYYDLKK